MREMKPGITDILCSVEPTLTFFFPLSPEALKYFFFFFLKGVPIVIGVHIVAQWKRI